MTRRPRMLSAARLAAVMMPWSSLTTMPSSSDATTAVYRSSRARRAASERRRSVMSAHTATAPVTFGSWPAPSWSITRATEMRTSSSVPSERRCTVSRCLAGSSPSRVSAPTTSAKRRPTTASMLQPYISSAAGFQLSMRPFLVEADDRVGDVLDELRLVAQRRLGLLAQGEVADDDLVGGPPVPLGADAERLDHDLGAVETDQRRFRGLGRGLVLFQRRDALEGLEQRVGMDELGDGLAEVVVEVVDADELGRGLVRPADQAVLVHDDAVGAQLEQEPVAVGLLLQRLFRAAARGDVGEHADAADDLAGDVNGRPGADEEHALVALRDRGPSARARSRPRVRRLRRR